jgi:hypothetical protein
MWPDSPVRYDSPDSEFTFSRIWEGLLVREPILNITVKTAKLAIPEHGWPAVLGHIFTESAKFPDLNWAPVYRPFFLVSCQACICRIPTCPSWRHRKWIFVTVCANGNPCMHLPRRLAEESFWCTYVMKFLPKFAVCPFELVLRYASLKGLRVWNLQEKVSHVLSLIVSCSCHVFLPVKRNSETRPMINS